MMFFYKSISIDLIYTEVVITYEKRKKFSEKCQITACYDKQFTNNINLSDNTGSELSQQLLISSSNSTPSLALGSEMGSTSKIYFSTLKPSKIV